MKTTVARELGLEEEVRARAAKMSCAQINARIDHLLDCIMTSTLSAEVRDVARAEAALLAQILNRRQTPAN